MEKKPQKNVVVKVTLVFQKRNQNGSIQIESVCEMQTVHLVK